MSNLPNVTDSDPLTPDENRVHDSNYVLNELKRILLQSGDAFGKSVRLGTTNEADIASHYNYNPERHRVYVDGARQFIQYDGEPAQFSDEVDSFLLKPQTSGETVTISTAERFRYVVQYVVEWSLAFQTNQALQSGDVWAVGYGNPDLENSTDDTPGPNADGWIVYQNSSDTADTATLAEYRDGSEQEAVQVTLQRLPDVWGRLAGNTNWYNVGETSIEETFTEAQGDQIKQRNFSLGTVANNEGKGPIQGNQRIRASVKAGDGAGTLELEVGSMGLRTLGDVTAITRQKAFSYSEQIDTTGAWIPVLAIRGDPERENVNVQIDEIDVLEFTGSDDSFALLINYDPANIADANGDPLQDANYSSPPEVNNFNSVIEVNTNVDQVADNNGVLQTSMQDPGGYQVGFASLYSSGAGASQTRTQSQAVVQKRQIPNGDVAVLLVKSPSTGTIKGQILTEQDF